MSANSKLPPQPLLPVDLRKLLGVVEHVYLELALIEADTKNGAARLLKMPARSFRYRIEKFRKREGWQPKEGPMKTWLEAIIAVHNLNTARKENLRPTIRIGEKSWLKLMQELKNDGFDIDPLDPPTHIRLHEVDLELDEREETPPRNRS